MLPIAQRIAQANAQLHPLATSHEGTLGRPIPEPEDELRFPFQRDRDRILHSTSFRRLQGKTQVFVAGQGDHFRTRLTHTLEVAQIARDIGRAMGLNEDLTECIALAHDLGHPPFGHVGEEALNEWMLAHDAHFEHNEQSYHIVMTLEKRSSLYSGLNLNREVSDGLLKHSSHHPDDGRLLEPSLEAMLANLADEVAYTSHDCDDALMGELFPLRDLIQIPLAAQAYERSKTRGTYLRGSLVHLLATDLIETSMPLLTEGSTQKQLLFSASMRQSIDELRSFLADRMYMHPKVRTRAVEGQRIIKLLCDEYWERPSEKILAIEERTEGSRIHAIKDYVSGMTDNFAWMQAAELGLLEVL